MKKCKEGFKRDIETAERNLLIASWLGIFSSICVIAYSILAA